MIEVDGSMTGGTWGPPWKTGAFANLGVLCPLVGRLHSARSTAKVRFLALLQNTDCFLDLPFLFHSPFGVFFRVTISIVCVPHHPEPTRWKLLGRPRMA